jgi:hypothetical protein
MAKKRTKATATPGPRVYKLTAAELSYYKALQATGQGEKAANAISMLAIHLGFRSSGFFTGGKYRNCIVEL